MVKDEVITIRLDGPVKRLIEQAAQRKGITMTSFVVSTAVKAAQKVLTEKIEPGRFQGVPTYFRAACREASRGGALGYEMPGYTLTQHLPAPYDIEDDDWPEFIQELAKAANSRDEEGILAWFDRHYPKCMALVPKRRRRQFAAGVQRAAKDEVAAWI